MNLIAILFTISTALVSSICIAQPYSDETAFMIQTADSLTIYGDIYDPDEERPLILLFHQGGGDGRGEYGPLVPRLLEEGFSAISIDQRRGGDRFGGPNRTIAAAPETDWSYCDAAPDLAATLDYAMNRYPDRSIILWGSSYSTGLAVHLAAQRGDQVAGVLAFSPSSGPPLEGCNPEEASAKLTVPALFLRPASEFANESTRMQLENFAKEGHQTYVAENGVHGSSMLNSDRTKSDTEETWQVVLTFLRSLNDS